MLYLESTCTDPAWNLALEQHLFDTVGRERDMFLLWQNRDAVVVGRHQNTAAEVDGEAVRAHGIKVVRRLSGGGAVYHDLGNLNFTFLAGAGETAALDLGRFCQAVAEALGALGVRAERSGRNDLTVDGCKFSGSAQYRRDGRVIHHGTILFDADLGMVGRVLRPAPEKLESKGVASVRSRVTNLRPYLPAGTTLEEFKALLTRGVLGDGGEPYGLTEADREAVERLRRTRYDTWEWNYGASPRYSLRKAGRIEGVGCLELYLQVEEGRVEGVEVFGDFFGDGDGAALTGALRGRRMEEGDLLDALGAVDLERLFHRLDAGTLVRLMLY